MQICAEEAKVMQPVSGEGPGAPRLKPASLSRGQLRRFPVLLQLFRVCKAANPRPCVIPSQSVGLASAQS